MKKLLAPAWLILLLLSAVNLQAADSTHYPALHPYIEYTGRFQPVSDGQQVWASGAYVTIRFKGTYCAVELLDEFKWNKSYNYLHVIVDGKEISRIRTVGQNNRLLLAEGLSDTEHVIIVAKDTESMMGYVRFRSWICDQLLPAPPGPSRKIEFIGNSITCGMGADESAQACGKGEWYDQHNAWNAYGPTTARQLNASWHLSSESGIGLIHSCCDKPRVMPEIFDKANFGDNQVSWSFDRYQPDLVSICLGQNDGIQDSVLFCRAYVDFIETIRSKYPHASLLLLSSPMADEALRATQQKFLPAIQKAALKKRAGNISVYVFKTTFNSGCSFHPSRSEHARISAEITSHIQSWLGW